MRPISQISKKEVGQIKMVVFDVDGVLVPRGTKIKQVGQTTTLHTKVIAQKQIEQIKELNKKGFLINISSGRGLYMLQDMFREVLPFVSLTYENGSATWYKGKIYQHINSFEPKEFIITIHCKKKVPAIERVVKKEGGLYTIWNGEAYDIGIKKRQTKALGLRHLLKIFKLKRANVMAIGDNYNDHELLRESDIPVSADKNRLWGKFHIPLKGKLLPADILMQKILSFLKQEKYFTSQH